MGCSEWGVRVGCPGRGVRVGCSGGVFGWGVRVGCSGGMFGWGVRVGCSPHPLSLVGHTPPERQHRKTPAPGWGVRVGCSGARVCGVRVLVYARKRQNLRVGRRACLLM